MALGSKVSLTGARLTRTEPIPPRRTTRRATWHHADKPADQAQSALSTVSIVDAATRAIVRRIDVLGAVHHVAVSPDGKVAAVTHPNANAVSVIDLEEMTVAKTLPTGTMPNYAVFSPDGAALYVSNAGDGSVVVID